MDFCRQFAGIFIFVSIILCVNGWRCETLECITYPQSLRLWRHLIEVSSKSFTVKAGSSFSITCDGSCVGSHADPHLRWYGPDKNWISYEGQRNRIHVEKSFSRRFQKLQFRKVTASDQGYYVCRGWLGEKHGWDMKSFKLIVDSQSSPKVTTKSTKTTINRILSTTKAPRIPQKLTTRLQTTQATTRKTERVTTRPRPTATNMQIMTQTNSTVENITNTTDNTTDDDCYPPKFRCDSGECFEQRYVCDSYPDCLDASDEKLCVTQTCTEDMQGCDDGDGCVLKSQICDGIAQCRDQSDEAPDLCNYLHL